MEEVFHVAHGRSEAIGEGGHVSDACIARRAVHFGGFGEVESEWFFAHDVFAMANAFECLFAVDEVGSGDDDGIDIGISSELSEVVVCFDRAPLGLALQQQFVVGIADGGE